MSLVAKVVVWFGVVFLATSPSWGQVSPQRLVLCAACHGDAGNSQTKGIPSFAAQPKLFLEPTLILMREGMREVPAMKGMLDGVTDAEVIELANFYSALTLVTLPQIRKQICSTKVSSLPVACVVEFAICPITWGVSRCPG